MMYSNKRFIENSS